MNIPSDYLMEVNLMIKNNSVCESLFKEFRSENSICAGDDGKDSCHGDSGGSVRILLLNPIILY